MASLVMTWVAASAASSRAKHSGDEWVYRPALVFTAIWCIGTTFFTYLLILGLLDFKTDQEIGYWIIFGVFVFFLVTWPKTVFVIRSGIKQRGWNLKWKSIEWSETPSVKQEKDGSVVVRAGKKKITVASYLLGYSQFLDNVPVHLRPAVKHPHHKNG